MAFIIGRGEPRVVLFRSFLTLSGLDNNIFLNKLYSLFIFIKYTFIIILVQHIDPPFWELAL